MNHHQEFFGQGTINDLRIGLQQDDPIVYSDNGFRSQDGRTFLKRIEALLPKLGITRVANISYMAAHAFPVYQTTRPNLFHHNRIGMNTGSQGKGTTDVQAKISCIMEAIEAYCAEPRNPVLVRGAYQDLVKSHITVPQNNFFRRYQAPHIGDDVPLIWTKAYHVGLDCEVLIPAEPVYAFILPGNYDSASYFAASTNGLASGATYLEACIHALYEVIERFYIAHLEQGTAKAETLFENEYAAFDLAAFNRAHQGQYQLQLFAITIPGITNIPMVECYLVGHDAAYKGHGCALDVDIAFSRAVSESMQSLATIISGSREDIHSPHVRKVLAPRLKTRDIYSTKRTLHISDYRNSLHSKQLNFKSLKEEFNFIVSWLEQLGFGDICIANLTRQGVDIPVVKVVVPHLPAGRTIQQVYKEPWYTDMDITKFRFAMADEKAGTPCQ